MEKIVASAGDYVDYKLTAGRGRPQTGQVVRDAGIGYRIQEFKTKQVIFVPHGKVIRRSMDRVNLPDWLQKKKIAVAEAA